MVGLVEIAVDGGLEIDDRAEAFLRVLRDLRVRQPSGARNSQEDFPASWAGGYHASSRRCFQST
jgi:hypothetical protein